MDILQLQKDAEAARPKSRSPESQTKAASQRDDGPDALWLADTQDVGVAPAESQIVTQRIAVPQPAARNVDRREPTLSPAVELGVATPAPDRREPPQLRISSLDPVERRNAPETQLGAPASAQPVVVPASAIIGTPEPSVEESTPANLVPDGKPNSNDPQPGPSSSDGASPVAPAKKRFAKLRRLFADFIGRERAKVAANKAKKKQQNDDEKNKESSVKKRNFALPVALVVLGLLAIGLFLNGKLSDMEKRSGVATEGKPLAPALADATALLTGAGGEAQVAGANQLSKEGAQPTSSNGAVAPAFESSPAPYTPPASPSKSGDPYLDKLRELKGELSANGGAGKSPSKLPAEIANERVPSGSPSRAAGRPRTSQPAFAAEPTAPIPDEIEAGAKVRVEQRDPLERVAVLGRMAVESGAIAPYLVAQLRYNPQGSVAYLYPKNSDPLLSGRWYQVGDQTDDGWTVVAISRSSVNVVSPRGRVFEINS